MLDKEDIEEFKKIYFEQYKEEISDAEALELGESLLSLFRIIIHPVPEEERGKYRQKPASLT